MKLCSKCREYLKASCFHKNASRPSGRHDQCKSCRCHPPLPTFNQVNFNLGIRKCSTCAQVLPLDQFHKHSRNPDGVRNECKKCRVLESKRYFLKYRELLNEKKRLWTLKHPRKTKRLRREIMKRYRDNNPLKSEARWRLNMAIGSGIVKRLPCVVCSNKKSEAHHVDYKKPLEVMWMCRQHHRAWHRLFTTEQQ